MDCAEAVDRSRTHAAGCTRTHREEGHESDETAKAYSDLMIALGRGMHDGAKQKIFTPMHYWLARKPN
jgi:hypothetical protein